MMLCDAWRSWWGRSIPVAGLRSLLYSPSNTSSHNKSQNIFSTGYTAPWLNSCCSTYDQLFIKIPVNRGLLEGNRNWFVHGEDVVNLFCVNILTAWSRQDCVFTSKVGGQWIWKTLSQLSQDSRKTCWFVRELNQRLVEISSQSDWL